ncbi:MAG: HD domain-containing protein [Fusicatenibacter sp.]|nr:HD domain-containing protein [Lachnospiraceae bacterium]MDY2937984.1 HD domain-containing protein [Fusicatenibacter sp.]
MIDLEKAKKVFDSYTAAYDPSIPEIRLKIIHTYAVVSCMEALCSRMHLPEEDCRLACLIALLHDIGRFEQWMRYQSFVDYETVDHAQFSSDLLFGDGLIRRFIDTPVYDGIISAAIEEHNKYKVASGYDERTLLFIHLIRDADKLDNYRVKEEESIETLLGVSAEEANNSFISPAVYDQMNRQELIYSPNRQTPLDVWLSYGAYTFDLHFPESLLYLKEHNWIERIFGRLLPTDPKVRQQYEHLKVRTLEYIEMK